MEIKKEILPKSKVKLTITVPNSEMDGYLKMGLGKLKKDVEIKGFRAGKAPDKMVIEKLGEQRIASEALDLALPETYLRAITKEQIVPLEPPKISIKQFEKEKDLIYEVEVSVIPVVTLPNLKNIKIKKNNIKVEEEEIERALKDLRKRMATFEDKMEAAAKGDFVELDFEGSVDRVKLDKLTSKNHPMVLGETSLIPGFEEQVIGIKKGDEKEFKLTLPKNHPDKNVAGKVAEFKIKANAVKKIILPEIDQKFAEKLGSKNVENLWAKFSEAIKKQKEEVEERRSELEMVKDIAGKIKVEMPEVLVNQELERLISDIAARVQAQGMPFEDYLKNVKKEKKDLENELRDQALENVKIGLTLAEIGRKEKIEVTDHEIENEKKRMINEGVVAGMLREELEKNYEGDQGKRYIENFLRNRKTIARLKELAEK